MLTKTKLIPTLIVALVVVLVGGTTAFAEKAIPGDVLYGMKISISEPIASIFALVSKEEKAEWQERLVERRLEEARRLVSNGTFDETTRVALENRINAQIDGFKTTLDALALKKGEAITSSDINIRLQASLEAYQNVLKALSDAPASNAAIQQETAQFLATLEASQEKVRLDHESLAQQIGSTQQNSSTGVTGTVMDATSVLAKQTAAESILRALKLSYQKDKLKLSQNIQTEIDGKLGLSETALEKGVAFAGASDFANAIDQFQSVISSVNEAKLLMLSNVLKNGIRNGDDGDDTDIEDDDLRGSEHDRNSNSSELESTKPYSGQYEPSRSHEESDTEYDD